MAQKKINYSFANDGLGDPLRQAFVKSDDNFDELYANKVDKIAGKSLTDVNFSAIDKAKLDSINPNTSSQSDFAINDPLNPAFIKNKPTLLSQFDNNLDFVEDVVTAGVFGRSAGAWSTIDLSSKENTANKQNSLAVDGTGNKYPTIDIINSGVSVLDGTSKIKNFNLNNQDGNSGQLKSTNLVEYTNFTAGKMVSWVDGSLSDNSDTKASGFIEVVAGLKYRYIDKVGSLGFIGIAYYDRNQAFISGEFVNATDYLFTIPTNVYFARVSFQNTANPINRDYFYQSYKFASYGDSITAQNQWQPKLSDALSLTSVVVGYGGAPMTGTASGALNQNTRLNTIPTDADIVTVMCGTNDWVTGYSIGSYDSNDVTTFSGALNSAFKKIKARCPNAIIIALATTYGMYPNYFSNPIGILNDNGLSTLDYAFAVKEIAKRNGVKYINTDLLWSNQNIASYVLFDGAYLHPNSSGGAEMAAAIAIDMVDVVLELKNRLKANIVSPTFIGTPTAPTAPAGTNTTQIATTAFVLANSATTSGIYTPTPSDFSNGDSFVLNQAVYIKTGNIVSVTVSFSMSVLSPNTSTQVAVTLPFNRSVTTSRNIGIVTGSTLSDVFTNGLVITYPADSAKAAIICKPTVSGTMAFVMNFTYSIN